MSTVSLVPLSPIKVSAITNRVRTAILEYRKANDELKIRLAQEHLSQQRAFIFFKRTVQVSREDAIAYLKKGDWMSPAYFGRYPSVNFSAEVELCDNLDTAIRLMGFTANKHLQVSVTALANLEQAYADCGGVLDAS